jgi:hypothetical protein
MHSGCSRDAKPACCSTSLDELQRRLGALEAYAMSKGLEVNVSKSHVVA